MKRAATIVRPIEGGHQVNGLCEDIQSLAFYREDTVGSMPPWELDLMPHDIDTSGLNGPYVTVAVVTL